VSFRWPALVLLLLSGNAYSYEFPVEIFEYVDNIKVVAFINESDIDETVSWQPFQGPPPLSIGSAIEAIQGYISSDSRLPNASLMEIKLQQIPHHDAHWHYLVKIKTETGDKTRYDYFVILMNSKIIPAVREPQSYK